MSDPFEKRIRRAEFLEKEWPYSAEALGFLLGVFRIQRDYHLKCRDPKGPIIAHPSFTEFLPALATWVEAKGPPTLTKAAEQVMALPFLEQVSARQAFISVNRPAVLPVNFFWLALSQPSLSASLGEPGREKETSALQPADCPGCRHLPVVSLLREDKQAETVRRSLVCSLCPLEWDFARVLCPGCREERPERLPRFTAQEIPWIQIEACDNCGRYLKGIDLTKNPDADPIVDELASTPLDAIAAERGYAKLTPNLLGL